jgi:hypothetical protein
MFSEFVIHRPTDGVYLGNCLGLGFWYNLDPVGQPAAATFSSVQEAKAHIRVWEANPDYPQQTLPDLKIVPVTVKESGFATIKECVAAGLPPWTPNPQEEQALAT